MKHHYTINGYDLRFHRRVLSPGEGVTLVYACIDCGMRVGVKENHKRPTRMLASGIRTTERIWGAAKEE